MLDQSEARTAIKNGNCPICGKTGFANIARHFFLSHSITRRELSDHYGFDYTESICSPAFAEKMRQSMLERKQLPPPPMKGQPQPNNRPKSKAGKEKQMAGLIPYKKGELHPTARNTKRKPDA